MSTINDCCKLGNVYFKVFRVYARYKKSTIKGGSGYDLIKSRDEIFAELNAWLDLVKPEVIYNIWYDYETIVHANGIPFWELQIIYGGGKSFELENFEDIIRRIKELIDWSLVDDKCEKKLLSIVSKFLKHGSMKKLRKNLLDYIAPLKHKATAKRQKNTMAGKKDECM